MKTEGIDVVPRLPHLSPCSLWGDAKCKSLQQSKYIFSGFLQVLISALKQVLASASKQVLVSALKQVFGSALKLVSALKQVFSASKQVN